MPSDDSNNSGLNTKPDFSSVPLPEPAPNKTPYAPTGGTLGDFAENIEMDNKNTDQPATTIPTPGVITKEATAPTEPSQGAIKLTDKKPKGKKLPFIIGGAVAAAAVAGIAIFFLVAKPSGNDGGNIGASGNQFFATSSFFVPSDEKSITTYAIFNSEGEAVTGFDYTMAPDYFIADAALVKKDKKYGLIDTKGNEIVPFGQYDKIKKYGALYGLTKDGKQILVNNKGEEVVEYTDENIGNYTDHDSNKDTAYTLLHSGGHYTVYNPYGDKSAEFDSTLVPTITTPSFGEKGAQTVIVYSGGIIVLDDKGNEIRRVERSISKKLFGIFISRDSKLIGLSTANEPIVSAFGGITAPIDKRDNALIIDQAYYDYGNNTCAGLYYDERYADDDDASGYVLCARGYFSYPITSTGDISPGYYSQSTAAYVPTQLVSNGAAFPVSINSYAISEDSGIDVVKGKKTIYKIFYKNQEVDTFVSTGQMTADSDNYTKTTSSVTYNFFGMADGYIVNRAEEETVRKYANSNFTDLTGLKSTAVGKVVFYNKKGKEICTFDKDGYYGTASRANTVNPSQKSVSMADMSSITGFMNGIAQVRKVNSDDDNFAFVNINDKCEIEDEKASYAQSRKYGDVVITSKKTKNSFSHEIRNKQNKIIATIDSKEQTPSVITYVDNYITVYGKDKQYFIIGDKIAKEFSHFCAVGSRIEYTSRYVQINSGDASSFCNDKDAISSEHLYFLPDGKSFYHWEEK